MKISEKVVEYMRIIFWFSLAVTVYVYAGYPLILAVLRRWARLTYADENYLPTVSLVIAAYNEEKVLHEKLGSGREYIRWITASQGKEIRVITVEEICYFERLRRASHVRRI